MPPPRTLIGHSSSLPLLGEGERRQVLAEFNRTEVAYPSDVCLHELIEQQVTRSPDAPAVVFEDRQLDYRTLDRRANQLAHRLRELGARPGETVAVCAERSLELVIALLAVLKSRRRLRPA